MTYPHIKVVDYSQTGHLLSMLMCTHPCSTHQGGGRRPAPPGGGAARGPAPQVVRVATTAQEEMKSWRKTSRSSKIKTSFRRGLAATPSLLPMKAACIYVSFSHFDYH
jgi:hypothetical protein